MRASLSSSPMRDSQPWLALFLALSSCREIDVVARSTDGGFDSTRCGGHGTWAETDGGGHCRCAAGFVERSLGWCEAIGPQTGCSNAWCPQGQGCELESSRCVDVAPDHCGLSREPLGFSTEACRTDADAGVTRHCRAGLVCVNQRTVAEPLSGALEWRGQCLQACDPCAPAACAADSECIALPGHGGFCTHRRLLGLGELCVEGTCGGLLACGSSFTCVTPCVPDDPAYRNLSSFDFLSTGFKSEFCAENELCAVRDYGFAGSDGSDHDGFECIERVGPVGSSCSDRPGLVCPFSSFCTAGVCSDDCLGAPCPAGVDCFARTSAGRVFYSCIRDDAVPLGYPCAEDRNCVSSYVCRAASDGGGDWRCVQP